jgi:hypothetical protein
MEREDSQETATEWFLDTDAYNSLLRILFFL